MSRWVVLLKENKDFDDITSWVYHKSFDSREAANEKGIEWCKMHEEAFSNRGGLCEYEEHSLFLKDEKSDGWWFICGYDIYPIDYKEEEQPEPM